MLETYCLNCLHLYKTKSTFEKHKNVSKDHDCCHIEMPKEDNKVLKIKSWRNVYESSIYYLCWLRVLA